jgi:acetyl-CoA C-acetyltransferase
MEKDVAIVGTGQSPFMRRCGLSIGELCFLAYQEAMKGINLKNEQINASVICSATEYDKQRSPAGVVSDYLNLMKKPTFCVESLCSSSSSGLRVAYSLIKAGLHDVVAVIGFQKMSELTSAEAAERMGRSGDVMWESPFGMTMPAAFAMFARAHMAEYGTTEEQLAKVRAKNSIYGVLNDKAAFRKEVTVEEVMNSRMVVNPLKLLDCCANADGAVTLILANRDVAKKITNKPIWIHGLGASSSSATLAGRETYSSILCTREAAQIAYDMAGIGPEDIDVAEVHDCFTITEIINYEDLGFAKPGEGVKLLEDGETFFGGKIPVNLDGGLLCKGHPIGATGGSQIRTIVRQLRGECREMQVENAKIGLVHNLGGAGVYCFVTIFGRD